jgi:hypothetical protein
MKGKIQLGVCPGGSAKVTLELAACAFTDALEPVSPTATRLTLSMHAAAPTRIAARDHPRPDSNNFDLPKKLAIFSPWFIYGNYLDLT